MRWDGVAVGNVGLECMELAFGNNVAESLWEWINNKADITVKLHCKPLSQVNDKLFILYVIWDISRIIIYYIVYNSIIYNNIYNR